MINKNDLRLRIIDSLFSEKHLEQLQTNLKKLHGVSALVFWREVKNTVQELATRTRDVIGDAVVNKDFVTAYMNRLNEVHKYAEKKLMIHVPYRSKN